MPTCSFPAFRLNQPMYLSSPIIVANARLASCNARCVLRDITECNALNQPNASCASVALNIHEWIPSGECNSMERFSERNLKRILLENYLFEIEKFCFCGFSRLFPLTLVKKKV